MYMVRRVRCLARCAGLEQLERESIGQQSNKLETCALHSASASSSALHVYMVLRSV